MVNMQTDFKKIGQQMDEKNVKYRPAIDRLFKASGMDGADSAIDNAASLMAAQEREEFEAVSSRSFGPEYVGLMHGRSLIIAHQDYQGHREREFH